MQLQNNMEDKVDSIKCITAWKESWRLRVKIVRLWFYTDPLAEDNEKLLHMILMDQNLDKIQATVKEPYISIFVDDLYVGGAFCMTSFSVVPNIGIMKMTHHRFKLLFQKGTTVIPEPSLQIRDSGFSFCSMFEILEKKSDYHYLIDFIGVITSVRHQTEVDYYGKKLKLMILEIYADGKKVQCNVFGKCCDSLDNSILMKFERLPVIVLQSFKIKVYGDEVCLQNVLNVSDILINPDLQETVRFLERLDVASYHFFSFKKNIHGSLVSYINHDSFDWRRIRTIQLIQQKMENGFFFVAGKIKQVVGDGHWWSFSCVCGHSVQKHSHENFYCQVCDKNIDNVIASYRVKIIVEDSTSSGIFVLLNAAATKLFGKSCSVALDQFQKELNDFNHPLHHAFFEVVVGKELILKIEFTELIKEEFGGMFKVITILDDRQTGLGLSVDSHINDTFQAPAYTPICEADFHYSEIEKYTSRIPFDASIDANNIDEMLLDSISTGFNCATPDPDVYGLLLGSIVSVIKEQKWWYSSCLCGGVTRAIKGSFFCDMCELECVDVIPSYRIKVIISHANGSNVFLLHDREITQIIKKRCSALLNENPHLKQTNTERKVPPELGNYLIQRKMVFMIDPRPLGYQYNTSVYMVHRICDDMSLEYFMDIGCLSEATVNMEKKMDDSLLDEEVDCASSMALPDSSSYGVAEHELQNAFKICMQHQSDPTSMH
ncbi:Replication protein A 70 kDa DNA-binding subunit A [Arachis hypogaea]|nr:Replication protein A 70 kDa DNA-binding subunit A [Arachis hypogaea]